MYNMIGMGSYVWWYDVIYYPLIANIGKTRQGVIKACKAKLS